MNKNERRAGETAKLSKRRTPKTPVEITDEPNGVNIRITGAAFRNLQEITAILNEWDNADNTPADITRRFLCCGGWWDNLAVKKPRDPYAQTLASSICDAYGSEADLNELESALNKAGFSTSR